MALVKFTSALKRFEPELTDLNLSGDTVGSIMNKVAPKYAEDLVSSDRGDSWNAASHNLAQTYSVKFTS